MTAPAGPFIDAGVEVQRASERFIRAADALVPLYQLSEEFNALVGLLEAPDQDAEAIDAELDRVAADIKAKGYGIAVVIHAIENKAAMLKIEEQRLYAKRKAAENAAERMRAYTLAQLKSIGIDRLDYGTFTLSVRQNPAHVDILNEPVLARVEAYETMPEVPPEFVRLITLYKVDKRAIAAAVKASGEVVPGARVARTESLSIR
jgi:Siphovirus Gp157